MKVILLAVLCLSAFAQEEEDDTLGFEFHEIIEDDADGVLHYAFPELIDFINADKNCKWEAGYNSYFKGRTKEDATVLMGTLPREPHPDDPVSGHPVESTPSHFDARTQWAHCPSIGEIRDQSACGSCWAFGAVEAMTDRICIESQGKSKPRLSAEDLLSCCTECGRGCQGGEPLVAWQYWVGEGIVSGGNKSEPSGCRPYPFPACDHHITEGHYKECPIEEYETPECSIDCQVSYDVSYIKDKHYGASAYTVAGTEAAIRSEIFTHGPVEASLDVYEDFPHYKSGVYHHVAGGYIGGHAVRILGWGTEDGVDYWLVANSWNADWGLKGFFKIKRGVDECKIESGVVAGIPKPNYVKLDK